MGTKTHNRVIGGVLELAKSFNNFYFKLQGNQQQVPVATPLVVKHNNHTQQKEQQQQHTIIGLLLPPIQEKLVKEHAEFFKERRINTTQEEGSGSVIEFDYGGDYEVGSEIIAKLLGVWRAEDKLLTLRGWRDECFEVKPSSGYSRDGRRALFSMERSATCLFGIRQYGVDINGYVEHPERGLCLWLQKRATNKQTWPGCMDNMVGGGLATGYSVTETALKEAEEEAGIPQEYLAKNLSPAGTVSFFFESERGLFPNTEFVFDLKLPAEFVPQNQDGEVESFSLVTAGEALSHCLSPQFKRTSCPVTLDFLVRHGVLGVENAPDLPEITELLHTNLTQLYHNLTLSS